jgi:uncharacterized membrane protein
MSDSNPKRTPHMVVIILLVLGLLFVALALAADALGLDITPGFGVIQVVALLAGITMLTLAALAYLRSIRPKEAPRSLQADIATRLIATGLVFTYVAGLSDLIGIGTHVEPSFQRPFIGPLQLGGVVIGLVLIVTGLILYHTSRGQRESSSLGFLVNDRSNGDKDQE